MTAGAVRIILKLPVDMTIVAFEFIVDFIQPQAGDRMGECLLVPAAVAIYTIRIKPGNPLSGRMAGAAVQPSMEFTEWPAGIGMRERRFFSPIVAFRTLMQSMAAGADSVNLLIGFFQNCRLL